MKGLSIYDKSHIQGPALCIPNETRLKPVSHHTHCVNESAMHLQQQHQVVLSATAALYNKRVISGILQFLFINTVFCNINIL